MDRRPGTAQGTVSGAGAETVAAAALGWRGDQPYSLTMHDIYHAQDGAAEAQRVLLAPSGLPDKAHGRRELLIGELGFGTGLNLAAVADVCLRTGTRLHFVSFDAAPIAADEFAAICASRQRDHPIYAQLQACYPPLISGWHRRYLANGAITLSLFWGDAAAGLDDIGERQQQPFDAWFLDGFAPDRNPEMWAPELLARIGRLSSAGTTVATFTAASRVRRGLEAVGFAMRRVDQRPHKAHSLAGIFQGRPRSAAATAREVDVIGAGLAGASAARHLAERGIHVRVFEAQSTAAAGASGIPATVMHPRLLADGSDQARLRCQAYLYSSNWCAARLDGTASGVLQLPGKNADARRLRDLAEIYAASGDWLALLSAEAASARADWDIRSPALWFPHGRVIDTPALCNRLLDHPNIELQCASARTTPAEQPTVLACGVECNRFAAAGYLETAPVHGQVDIVRLTSVPTLPLVGNGYLIPRADDLLVGTTYEYQPWDPAAATAANLQQLSVLGMQSEWRARARATRCVTSDRTPIAGRLYAADNTPIENLYVSTGHGSMGTVFSHFAGALIAAQICGEFAPMTATLESAISSARFRLRQARRGLRHGARPPDPALSRS